MPDEFDARRRRIYRSAMRLRLLASRIQRSLWARDAEPILHSTPWRLRLAALFILIGNPLSAWVWTEVSTENYEQPVLRWCLSLLALPLLGLTWLRNGAYGWAVRYFVILIWLQIPVLFSWMFMANSGSSVWLATCAGGLVVYYGLKDWRIATLGVALGVAVAVAAHVWLSDAPAHGLWAWLDWSDVYVLGFFWVAALGLGISHADLQAERLQRTLTSVGVMAHELRTPLATVSMIGDALRGGNDGSRLSEKDRDLGMRLHALVRAMNHQIDTQITNASLIKPIPVYEVVSAQAAAKQAMLDYPFASARQRDAVKLRVVEDFEFLGALPVFAQVLSNLLKNALHAVSKAGKPWADGDITVEIRTHDDWGEIIVRDTGIGMDSYVQRHMFEPFFSTRNRLGHGLGLAFCEHAVRAANGRIAVVSELGAGTTFAIRLPTRSSWDRPST